MTRASVGRAFVFLVVVCTSTATTVEARRLAATTHQLLDLISALSVEEARLRAVRQEFEISDREDYMAGD